MPVIARISTEIVSISAGCSGDVEGEFKSLDMLTSGKGASGFSETTRLLNDDASGSLVIGISMLELFFSSSFGRITSKRAFTRVRVPAGDGVGVTSSFNGGKTIAEYFS